jgi:hypothetical protein
MAKPDFTKVQYAKTFGSAIFILKAESGQSHPITAEINAMALYRV